MCYYFQCWRRKSGLVLLAVALLFTVVWMRSYVVEDRLLIRNSPSLNTVVSSSGVLSWDRMTPFPFHQPIDWQSIDASDLEHSGLWSRWSFEWRWTMLGFEFGKVKWPFDKPVWVEVWVIPYWSLVLPLTLLSAYLILSKPSPAKLMKNSTRSP